MTARGKFHLLLGCLILRLSSAARRTQDFRGGGSQSQDRSQPQHPPPPRPLLQFSISINPRHPSYVFHFCYEFLNVVKTVDSCVGVSA